MKPTSVSFQSHTQFVLDDKKRTKARSVAASFSKRPSKNTLPVAHGLESWTFYRISLAGTWTATQFFAGPYPGPLPVPRISCPLALR
jgi:hypothetical protein